MVSCDTNILFPAFDKDSPFHSKAREFLMSCISRDNFCLCEQVLMELYCLLRNPTVCQAPMPAAEAVDIIRQLRANPHWRIIDHVQGFGIMDRVWKYASDKSFAYKKIFDMRLVCVLQHHGVKSFATRNLKDFQNMGFQELWNPLT